MWMSCHLRRCSCDDVFFFFRFEYILIYHWPLCRVKSGWKHTRKSSAISVQCSINIKRDMWYSHPDLSCVSVFSSVHVTCFFSSHSIVRRTFFSPTSLNLARCYGHLLLSKCVRDYNKHENSNITSLWSLALNQILVVR